MSNEIFMAGFESAAKRMQQLETTRLQKNKLLSFGVPMLDKAMHGIWESDLVLIGAGSGFGKTQFAVNMATANALAGKRVHFFALEANKNEIESRMKYSRLANRYYARSVFMRKEIPEPLNYTSWLLGRFDEALAEYEIEVCEELYGLNNFFTFYKWEKFGVDELTKNIFSIASETDLVIVDHVHYFDYEDTDNENKALRMIAKTAREVSQEVGKPIVLIAHLRKKDRKNTDLVPGMDEFHGSSDLTKIATKVISIGRGEDLGHGVFETYFRIAKCRLDGSLAFYMFSTQFNIKTLEYEPNFRVSKIGPEFEDLLEDKMPYWVKRKL